MYLRLLFISAVLYCADAKNEEYDGHLLYRIKTENVNQVKILNNIVGELLLDVWSYPIPGKDGLILVSKVTREVFENQLNWNKISYKVEVTNVKTLIHLEEQLFSATTARNNVSSLDLSFDTIHRYEAVDKYLVDLAERYSGTVQVVSAGRSFQGRDIKYLKISSSRFQDRSKPVVIIQSLLHAREWITLPVSLYAIKKLVVDVSEQDLVRHIDWIILPIVNPDGYEYSHTSSRFWRKNRANDYFGCVGVDLNRNFDVNWGTASSSLTCMETFHGRAPFSEPETRIVGNIINEHKHRLGLFLDIHNFGSMILYGFGNNQLPPNGLTLHLVGVNMANSIDSVKLPSNPNYIVGNIASVLYLASGGASSYAQTIPNTICYTFELPGYRNSISIIGFLVDPNFIEQAGYETWEGIKVAARYLVSGQ